MDTSDDAVTVVPANETNRADLEKVFGTRGPASVCFCQRYKLARGESFYNVPSAERADRLCEQAACGTPAATTTSGLVAYLDEEPVGWCAVEPRAAYGGLVRNSSRAAWVGRDEDRKDPTIWAVTCLLTRSGYRKRGVSRALAAAAVEFARSRGARALEAYPMRTTITALHEELHVGTVRTFEFAGLRIVHEPSKRRAVMRIDFDATNRP